MNRPCHPAAQFGAARCSPPRRLAGFALLACCLSDPPQSRTAEPPAFQPAYRVTALPVATEGATGFSSVDLAAAGIRFTNHVSRALTLTNSIVNNGSGLALGDIDGDGLDDIYFCGLEADNRLYRNLGNWKFADITRHSAIACPGQYSTGAAFADVDGDADLDLLVNGIGTGTRLFINNGQGEFVERADSGLIRRYAATSMALADFDHDGDLDLYVTNYRTTTIQDAPGTRFTIATENGRPVVTRVNGIPATHPDLVQRFSIGSHGQIIENGEPDLFYRNHGDGRFIAVDWTAGVFLDADARPLEAAPLDWGLAVMFRDANGDGAPDLYVCNDADSPDRFWINQGDGTFKAAPARVIRQFSLSSMGVDFADLDRDGDDDFIVLDMLGRSHLKRQTQLELPLPLPTSFGSSASQLQIPRNTLFLNLGDGEFAEIAHLAGVHATDWSWTPMFLDVDLDGYEDLLISNGFHFDVRDQDHLAAPATLSAGTAAAQMPPARAGLPHWLTANLAFHNQRDLTFKERGANWGFDHIGISQGMAAGDLDNDGDLDVVISNFDAPPLLLRNNAIAPRIAVRLRGRQPNTRAIGARISLIPVPQTDRASAPALPIQTQIMSAGGRYLSSDGPVRTFAGFDSTRTFRIEIRWPSGRHSRIEAVDANQAYEIHE